MNLRNYAVLISGLLAFSGCEYDVNNYLNNEAFKAADKSTSKNNLSKNKSSYYWINSDALGIEKLEGLDIKKLEGNIILLDFWATWCNPCVEELPNIEKIWQKYKNNEVIIIGVCKSKNKPENILYIEKLVKNKSLTFPVVIDTKGEIFDYYNVEEIPYKVLIDKKGFVKERGTKISLDMLLEE